MTIKEHKLPDSGATVRIKFIGPLLLNDLRRQSQKAAPRPEPPMQEVAYERGPKLEPNLLHPAYVAAQQEYDAAVGMKFIELLFRYGVDCDVDEAAVAALREQAAEDGLELPANDKTLYITRILVSSNADLDSLQEAVLGTQQPTDKAVGEALAGFPGDVQGG